LRKHLPRHRDLGHLERDVATVADDLGADLDQLLAQAGKRPRLRGLEMARLYAVLHAFENEIRSFIRDTVDEKLQAN
jgi:hypothetical protein